MYNIKLYNIKFYKILDLLSSLSMIIYKKSLTFKQEIKQEIKEHYQILSC